MLLFWRRKKRVRWVESQPNSRFAKDLLAGKRWSQEKLTEKLEEGSNTLKSVYRCVEGMVRRRRSASRDLSINSELPSYDLVIPALIESGIGSLREKRQLTPGVPLKPMLAKPTKAIGEVLDRFENKKFTCEYKYDGERAQVTPLLMVLFMLS